VDDAGFSGARVLFFESRRGTETAELIRRHRGEPVMAPALREVPLDENHAALDYLDRLEKGQIDIVVLMTGVGLRTLVETVAPRCSAERLAELLRQTRLVARGPKPVAALRDLHLSADVVVPEPNTWREILATLDTQLLVAGKRVAVQEYGISNVEFLEGLRQRGADVLPVPIYRWTLPEDVEPLRRAVNSLTTGDVDAALFTSATQVYHLFEVAAERADEMRRGCAGVIIASIGPVCSEALRKHGLEVDFEPTHPKLGQLVGELAQAAAGLSAAKRQQTNHP